MGFPKLGTFTLYVVWRRMVNGNVHGMENVGSWWKAYCGC
jgi:hypothetical protein